MVPAVSLGSDAELLRCETSRSQLLATCRATGAASSPCMNRCSVGGGGMRGEELEAGGTSLVRCC